MPTPEEVTYIYGTEGDDVMFVNQALIAAHDTNNVTMLGGDDAVVRDRTGMYTLMPGGWYHDTNLEGGTGADTVSYAALGTGVLADLGIGDGYGYVRQQLPGNAPAGQAWFGEDWVSGFERFVATTHNDTVLGGDWAERIYGHDGNDVVDGGFGKDTVWGGNGDDEIDGGLSDDRLYGEAGDDSIDGAAGKDTIYGGDDDDSIDGGAHNDVIYAGDGHDDILGGHGNDTIYLDDGADTADGGVGSDVIHVDGFGDHLILGGAGTDTVVFDGGATTVSLNAGFASRADGYDTIGGVENVLTGSSQDTITGSGVANLLKAGSGADTVSGLGGNDTIHGENGNDSLLGGSGNDNILGGSGNDRIDGSSGTDSIDGGTGSDRIRGGSGADTVTGGADADTFVWGIGDSGNDRIKGFDINQDKLSFDAGFFAAGPGGQVVLSQVLTSWDVHGDATLFAHTSWGGWTQLALIEDVDSAVLRQKIANSTILDIDVAGGGGPGGFDTDTLPGVDLGVHLGLVL